MGREQKKKSEVIKVNADSGEAEWLCVILIHVMEPARFLYVLLPKRRTPKNTMKKTSDISKLRDILQHIWPVLFKILKVVENKESLRNSHCQEELKETMMKSNVVF